MFFLSIKIIWDHTTRNLHVKYFLRLQLAACGWAREGQTPVSTNAVAPSIEGLLYNYLYGIIVDNVNLI